MFRACYESEAATYHVGGRLAPAESVNQRERTVDDVKTLIAEIRSLWGAERLELIEKGLSVDRKYVAFVDGEPRYVLRLSGLDQQTRRQGEFEALAELRRRGVRCSEPVEMGLSPAGGTCYAVVTYIVGDDADIVVPTLPEAQQRSIGFAAGQQLRLIHDVSAAESNGEWVARREAKYRRKRLAAEAAGLSFLGQDGVERHVEDNLGLLGTSLVRFQHDDFHLSNLIVRDGQFAGVIDFNRCDWGDPIEDFYKVPWFTVPLSVPFAIGQIHGYNLDGIAIDFWSRYNLFVGMTMLGSLLWAQEAKVKEGLGPWHERIAEIIATHDFDGGGPPSWFAN
jgi:aminoglycoside phosphotransferase (APT) family kinase protein